jgi:hypothetical protein
VSEISSSDIRLYEQTLNIGNYKIRGETGLKRGSSRLEKPHLAEGQKKRARKARCAKGK